MTEYDYWKIFPRMPKKVTIGDITVRDGFQHLEQFISTRAKTFYAEELIFAGCRNIEVTNLGNPYLMPHPAILWDRRLRIRPPAPPPARRGVRSLPRRGA